KAPSSPEPSPTCSAMESSTPTTTTGKRQVASYEFKTKSLRNFIENVVDAELSDRLLSILASAAASEKTLDFQDILQRFAFDNICRIAFGYDPEYLKLSTTTEKNKFVRAFEDATEIISDRFREPSAIIWKIKRRFDIGSEKRLQIAVSEARECAKELVREKNKNKKKMMIMKNSSLESVDNNNDDLLSWFLNSGHSDEEFLTDIVISFVLAGKDSTSAALTWFFWLLWKNPRVEEEIVKEIKEKSEAPVYEEVKEMVYTHAALCESMRLYPPIPSDSKEAVNDDVLPDGTVVKKGMMVRYHVYTMGRMESIWGRDWAEFRPERWLERVEGGGDGGGNKWKFVGMDPYSYPVFQAGLRICSGKEMSFMQMKRVVAGIVRRFRVVPAVGKGVEPEFISFLTSQMKGGFPVNIISRHQDEA
ncbi:hypothetical protein PIB30_056495, partial [Stylosanthes scabra]|nr:hypothetical protein [Stylosanthes scabra]